MKIKRKNEEQSTLFISSGLITELDDNELRPLRQIYTAQHRNSKNANDSSLYNHKRRKAFTLNSFSNALVYLLIQ